MTYDVIIIGGGVAGYYSALEAKKRGLSSLIITNDKLGGVCLNYGCIPSKFLIQKSNFLYKIKQKNSFLKVNDYSFDFKQLIIDKTIFIEKIVNQVISNLKLLNIEVIYGDAKLNQKKDNIFDVSVNSLHFYAFNLIIATGSSTSYPHLEGITNNDYVVDSRKLLDIKRLPNKVAIIGSGVIGIEMASYLAMLGVKIDIFHRKENILDPIDLELSKAAKSYFNLEYDITFFDNTKYQRIEKNSILFSINDTEYKNDYDLILVATGRKPNVDSLNLTDLNIDFDNKGIKVNDRMQTNQPNVYAIGDVKGFNMLAYVATMEANIAIQNINSEKKYMDYSLVPKVIYSHPEIASIGLSEEEAKKSNIQYYVKKISLNTIARFNIDNSGVPGFLKIIVDKKTEVIIGIHMFGDSSSELISIATIILNRKLKFSALENLILPHPSISEIFKLITI